MINKIQYIYKQNISIIYYLLLLLMLVGYALKVLNGSGGDLGLRISEAKYFLHGVNPYDVYIGRVERIDGYGYPNAYSFLSYYFAAPFTLIDSYFYQRIIFSLVDISALVGGIFLTNRMLNAKENHSAIITFVLLSSVFFWQQVNTLNYNLIATFGLLVVFYGLFCKNILYSVLGVIIIGLKPSIAIPVFVYLLFTRRWKPLFLSGVIYLSILFLTAMWTSTSPVDLLLQLKDTQSKFSNGHTDGFFYFIKPFIGDKITALGGVLTIVFIFLFREKLEDPLNGLVLVTALGIGFFYNHVHAWIISYPLLIIAISNYKDCDKSIFPIISMLIFLLVPRLSGLFGNDNIDLYVSIHNILRFGLLFVTAYFLVKSRHAAYKLS